MQSALEGQRRIKSIKELRSMVESNIRSGSVFTEMLGAINAVNHGAKVLVMRVYTEKVHHLFNYGMNACDDQALVKNCIEELFSSIAGRPDMLRDGGSVDTNLFKKFRRLLIQEIAYSKKKSTSDIRAKFFSSDLPIIRGLTNLQREALFLKFRSGLSYRDVASVLDMRIDQLRNQISKAADVLLRQE